MARSPRADKKAILLSTRAPRDLPVSVLTPVGPLSDARRFRLGVSPTESGGDAAFAEVAASPASSGYASPTRVSPRRGKESNPSMSEVLSMLQAGGRSQDVGIQQATAWACGMHYDELKTQLQELRSEAESADMTLDVLLGAMQSVGGAGEGEGQGEGEGEGERHRIPGSKTGVAVTPEEGASRPVVDGLARELEALLSPQLQLGE